MVSEGFRKQKLSVYKQTEKYKKKMISVKNPLEASLKTKELRYYKEYLEKDTEGKVKVGEGSSAIIKERRPKIGQLPAFIPLHEQHVND